MSKLYIDMFHYVRDLSHSRYPAIKGMNISTFKQQIAFLKYHFTIVRMEEVIEAYYGGKKLPDQAVLLTFDDGYVDHFQFVLPVLQEEGLQGSFFVPGKTFTEHKLLDVNKIHFILATADIGELVQEIYRQLDYYRGSEFDIPCNEELYRQCAGEDRLDDVDTIFVKRLLQAVLPERLRNTISSNLFTQYVGISEEVFAHELYLNYDQMKYMKRQGMYFGLHGYDHYWMETLDDENMQKDIDKALQAMEELIDRNLWVMNYPYGVYNEQVIHYIKENGCKFGVTTQVDIADTDRDNPYMVPRLDAVDLPPVSEHYKSFEKKERAGLYDE